MAFFKEEDFTLILVPLPVWHKNKDSIHDWLMTLPDEDYEYSKQHLMAPQYSSRGLYFRHEADIIAFKLMFGL